MNKTLLGLVIIVSAFSVKAQKFGHFSSDYVVKQLESYQTAKEEIDKLSLVWMNEVKDKYIEIGRLENKLEAEKVLLTTELIRERETAIEKKLKEAIDFQYRIFGPEGLFFLKKQELIKPELDKVFEAVERVCKNHNLDYLLDKSSELVIVYSNPVHDYTDFVLEELGLSNNP